MNNKLRNVIASVLAFGVLATAGVASADTTTAVDAGFDDLNAFLTTTAIPALIGLAVIGTVVTIGVKYLRKGGSKA